MSTIGQRRCSTFRWNIAKKEQLIRGVVATEQWPLPHFVEDVRECCAKVLVQSRGADLIFVGRSPESFFDYLTGILAGTSLSQCCKMLNVSLRNDSSDYEKLRCNDPIGLQNICQQFYSVGMSPEQIIHNPNPIALVDLVCAGFTFGHLSHFLLGWAKAENLNQAALLEKIRFVCIVMRSKSSPRAWRWWQHQEWISLFPKQAIKNVSIDIRLWHYFGNSQSKLSKTNPPCSWSYGDQEKKKFSRDLLDALNLARALYEVGTTREERQRFFQVLSSQHGSQHIEQVMKELRNPSTYHKKKRRQKRR